ncbi:hypothetical protein STEG23_012642 [Scotinomys teguina]
MGDESLGVKKAERFYKGYLICDPPMKGPCHDLQFENHCSGVKWPTICPTKPVQSSDSKVFSSSSAVGFLTGPPCQSSIGAQWEPRCVTELCKL